jgi:hypothetical protein
LFLYYAGSQISAMLSLPRNTPPPTPPGLRTPPCFVLPLVELWSFHNKLIVDENKMAFQVSVLIIWNSNLFFSSFLFSGHL